MAERLAKFMARSGVCSRREAEKLIEQKRVTINGEIVETPATLVEGNENILLDGEKLPKTELQKKGIKLLKFPFPLFVVLVFVVLGFALQDWHPAWLLFLLIPIYYHFAGALTVRKKKPRLLAMPVPEVIVLLYLICGFFFSLWSTAWVLFLAIPLYYWLVGCFYKEKTPSENER